MRNRKIRMSKRPTRGSSALWLKRRVDFLRARPELWGQGKQEIVRAMKEAGLIAPTTFWRDVKTQTYLDLIHQNVPALPGDRS